MLALVLALTLQQTPSEPAMTREAAAHRRQVAKDKLEEVRRNAAEANAGAVADAQLSTQRVGEDWIQKIAGVQVRIDEAKKQKKSKAEVFEAQTELKRLNAILEAEKKKARATATNKTEKVAADGRMAIAIAEADAAIEFANIDAELTMLNPTVKP